jgi:hypothetical protein
MQIPQMPYGVKHCTISGAMAVRKFQQYLLMPYCVCTVSSLSAFDFSLYSTCYALQGIERIQKRF